MNNFERLLEINARVRKEQMSKNKAKLEARKLEMKRRKDDIQFMREMNEIEKGFCYE